MRPAHEHHVSASEKHKGSMKEVHNAEEEAEGAVIPGLGFRNDNARRRTEQMCNPAAQEDGSDDSDNAAGVGTWEAGPIGAEVGGGDLKTPKPAP